MNDFYKQIGQKIKQARKIRNITQARLADELGLSRTSIVSIESGRHHISLERLIRIAELTDFAITEFIEEKGQVIPSKLYYHYNMPTELLRQLDKIPLPRLRDFILFYNAIGDTKRKKIKV